MQFTTKASGFACVVVEIFEVVFLRIRLGFLQIQLIKYYQLPHILIKLQIEKTCAVLGECED